MNRKIIEISGGLGNQMFQYALGVELKLRGFYVTYDDRKILITGNQHNGFELERVFKINYHRNGFWENLIVTMCRAHDKLTGKDRGMVLIDKEPTAINEIISKNKIYLRGYWQNPNYWEKCRGNLKDIFEFKIDHIDDRNKDIAKKIKSENSVSIHVRRGDYLWAENAEARMEICTLEYYKKAISYIYEKARNCSFYFFSDDPKWVRANFTELDYILIDWNQGENSYLDMYLMSLCKHNIIANSSFSWWGAVLNCNKEKIVVSPSKWYNGMSSDLIMNDWIKI